MIPFLFSGAFSALFAVIAELIVFSFLPFGSDPWNLHVGATFGYAALVSLTFVAVIEEGAKLSVLARQMRSFPVASPHVPAILFGLGFAMTEIGLASVSTGDGAWVPLPAAAGILVLHVLTSLLYGAAVGSGKIRLRNALIAGIVAHFFYDFILALI